MLQQFVGYVEPRSGEFEFVGESHEKSRDPKRPLNPGTRCLAVPGPISAILWRDE